MALERKDRVKDTTSTTGNGTITLDGSAPTGFRPFTGVVTDGATVRYLIESADSSEWEVGEGVFDNDTNTMTRVTVYASSNSGSKVVFSAGTKKVNLVFTSEDLPVKASRSEMAAGTDDAKFLTPLAAAELHQLSEGGLLNGKIVPSVASGNLTVAIKGKDGNDPSETNPVYAMINGALRSITSDLSVTVNAGTNTFNAGSAELSGKEIDYFVYLGYNATDGVVLGFSRYPGANSYDDFSATATNEKYCAISTITNAAATDYYNIIGRFAATKTAVDLTLGDNSASGGFDTNYWQAQVFTPTKATLGFVGLLLKKVGSPTGNLTIEIQSDNAGVPSGTVLATATLDVSTLTTSLAEYLISISATLTPSTKYHCCLKGQATWDGSNTIEWACKTGTGFDQWNYGAGNFNSNLTTRQCYLKTYYYGWSVPTFTAKNLIQRPIYETRFLSAIGTVSADTGSVTSASQTTKYKLIGNSIYIFTTIAITTNGTGGSKVKGTLPFTVQPFACSGRETQSTGYILSVFTNTPSSTVYLTEYDNTYPGGDGYSLNGTIVSTI